MVLSIANTIDSRFADMLELFQEGIAAVEQRLELPTDLRLYLIESAVPILFQGNQFDCLIQELKGDGFSAWFNRFWTTAPTVIRARGDIAVLELRIGIKNQLTGTWDKIINPVLPEYYFQLVIRPLS